MLVVSRRKRSHKIGAAAVVFVRSRGESLYKAAIVAAVVIIAYTGSKMSMFSLGRVGSFVLVFDCLPDRIVEENRAKILLVIHGRNKRLHPRIADDQVCASKDKGRL